MSNFKTGQSQAHPNKRNMIFSTLIVVLLINLMIQVWLLYVSLNNALENHKEVSLAAFIISLVLFSASAIWLFVLPGRKKS